MKNPRKFIEQINQRRIWFCNINQEQVWNDSKVFPGLTDSNQLQLIKQQEQQMLLIASLEDTVLLHNHLDEQYIAYLKQEGIELPQLLPIQELNHTIPLALLRKSAFIPYMQTEETTKFTKSATMSTIFESDQQLTKDLNNKFITRRLAMKNGFKVTSGYFCKNIEGLRSAFHSLIEEGFDKVVLKIPFGSSGKGLKVIEDVKTFEMTLKFIAKRSSAFELLLEGWYSVQRHLNCQMLVQADQVHQIAITEQKIDRNGVYLGTSFLPQYTEKILSEYQNEMARLGSILSEIGYSGFVGVDSILDKDGQMFPIIEINARFTQVTYLLPFIMERLIEKYIFIESQYIRLELKQDVNFNEMKQLLDQQLLPDQSNNYFIYTYATLINETITRYRIYLLFYGNSRSKIDEMILLFERFQSMF